VENVQKALLLKQEIDKMRPLDKIQEARIMQKFRLDWNYHSNHLEGNSLTFGETKALILHGITAQGKPLKDHFEITGHDEAIKWVEDVLKQKTPLTEHFIRQLHELLLKEPYEIDAITPDGKPTKRIVSVGKYKTVPNHVRTQTGEIFYFASPEETPAKMHDLMSWYNDQKQKENVNAILLAAEFHYRFIRIHPFDDGNGRTARILMNFILMQYGFPPVIIKTEDKENYYSVLRQADANIFEPFVEYIASNLIRSLEIMIVGAQGGNIEEENDVDKELFLIEQKLNAIGKKATVYKNRNSVQDVIVNSVIPVLRTLLNKSKVFEKFYARHLFSFTTDNRVLNNLTSNLDITNILIQISGEEGKLEFTNIFEHFTNIKLGEFNFSDRLTFYFNNTSYQFVSENRRYEIKKFYDEFFTENEINDIVNAELKYHSDYLNKCIEGYNKQSQ
jgi:Fic family protein